MKTTFRKAALICALLLAGCGHFFSQGFDKPVYKKFTQTDSLSINNAGVLILYADNSFINYGILKDLQNQEVYVWYTFGKWSLKNGQLVCNTFFEQFNQKKTIDMIKQNYRTRKDYRLIDSYYEYVNERYTDVAFVLVKNKAIDLSKKIEYIEVKEDTTTTN